jgi:lipopolysaccharide transport system permease protein
MTAVFQELRRHRWLLGSLVRRDLEQRYRGTFLDMLWPLAYAALLLALYTFVFAVVMQVQWPEVPAAMRGGSAFMIFAGLIPFMFVADVFTRGPSIVLSVPNLVRKVRFPLALLPWVATGSAGAFAVINTAVLIVAVLAFQGTLPATVALVPFLFVPMALLALGCAYFFGALGVFFRDLGQLTPLLAQVMMFLAPVCYPAAIVPPRLRELLGWNPITWFCETLRKLVLVGDTPSAASWLAVTAFWLAFALAGAFFFHRTRRMFADLV